MLDELNKTKTFELYVASENGFSYKIIKFKDNKNYSIRITQNLEDESVFSIPIVFDYLDVKNMKNEAIKTKNFLLIEGVKCLERIVVKEMHLIESKNNEKSALINTSL